MNLKNISGSTKMIVVGGVRVAESWVRAPALMALQAARPREVLRAAVCA